MELRAIASFASKVRVRDLGRRMKRAWSNERRHRSFSLVYVLPKWNVYKLKSFSQNSFYFTSFVRSGRITGPVSIFLMGHFVALCAIRAWRTAFLIPGLTMVTLTYDWHWCWDLKEWCGSLDTLSALIDGADIPLFLNSRDIFAKNHISFVELIAVMRINTSLL